MRNQAQIRALHHKPTSVIDMISTPPVEILMATYNGEAFIAEQLDSIISQDYGNWKMTIRDDGSTDNTIHILEEYAKSDDRIHIIRRMDSENSGVIRSYSSLLEQSSLQYIMLCDQDDVWDRSKISLSMSAMQDHEKRLAQAEPVLVHTDLSIVDHRLGLIDSSFWSHQRLRTRRNPPDMSLSRLLMQNAATGCTCLLNRRLVNMVTPIPDNVIVHDWWISIVAAAAGSIVSLNTSTIMYRQHSANYYGAHYAPYSGMKKPGDKVKYIVSAIARIIKRTRFNGFDGRIKQAIELQNRLLQVMTKQNKDATDNLINIDKFNWLRKRSIIVKHRLYLRGILNNCILFLRI